MLVVHAQVRCDLVRCVSSHVPPTVRAQDVIFTGEEAPSHQGYAALFAVEAVVVPLTLLEGDVLTATQTTDGSGAVGALLGKQVAETVEAVGKVITGREALSCQLLFTSNTHKALLMPRLVTVVHSSCGDGLLALCTLQGKLLLIAGHAVVMPLFLHKAPGADRLLAAVTGEAVLMPAAAFVLHLFGTWHDGLEAGVALGRVLIAVAVGAHEQLIFSGEGPLH